MKTIWKFPLTNGNGQRIEMPASASILCVQVQDRRPCLWVMVDVGDDSATEMRTFEIYGTGQAISEEMGFERAYIGTFQQSPFVWHLFERYEVRDDTTIALD